jgi:hypothetical protein
MNTETATLTREQIAVLVAEKLEARREREAEVRRNEKLRTDFAEFGRSAARHAVKLAYASVRGVSDYGGGRPYSTAVIIHSAEQDARFDYMLTFEDGHHIFHPLPGRAHFLCNTTIDGGSVHTISSLRFAKSRAGVLVGEDEIVRTTCGHTSSAVHSGEGGCVNPDHLEVVKFRS